MKFDEFFKEKKWLAEKFNLTYFHILSYHRKISDKRMEPFFGGHHSCSISRIRMMIYHYQNAYHYFHFPYHHENRAKLQYRQVLLAYDIPDTFVAP